MTDAVHHNEAEGRFELETEGGLATAAYARDGDTLVFTHTLVPHAAEGQGVGTTLIAGALAQVRAAGWRIVPQCPFVAHYLETHPQDADLVEA